MSSIRSILALAAFTSLALAKTDLSGCTTTDTVDPYGAASVLWYVPGSCEICAPLDCGGGRAPPKTTVPGCAAYSGTDTYSPSYFACNAAATPGPNTASATSSATSATSSAVSDGGAPYTGPTPGSSYVMTQPGPSVSASGSTITGFSSTSGGAPTTSGGLNATGTLIASGVTVSVPTSIITAGGASSGSAAGTSGRVSSSAAGSVSSSIVAQSTNAAVARGFKGAGILAGLLAGGVALL